VTGAPEHAAPTCWHLDLVLRADVPLRLAALVRIGQSVRWVLQHARAARAVAARATFLPYDSPGTEKVQIAFGFHRFTVADAAIKADPRSSLAMRLPVVAESGTVVPLAALPASHDTELSFVAFAEADTEYHRIGVWRVRPALAHALAPCLIPLTSGRQRGVVNLAAKG
jgi:hypothetical protein